MPNKCASLDPYAWLLNYPDEKAMLTDLYTVRLMTTSAIAKVIGQVSQSTVRLRLIRLGIPLRRPGGYMGRRATPPTLKGQTNEPTRP